MRLTVKDRIILQQILPQQASLKEIGNIIECSGLLDLTDKEKTEFGYKEENGSITWNPDMDTVREIKLKHDHVTVLKDAIQKLDDNGQVTVQQYETFLKVNKV